MELNSEIKYFKGVGEKRQVKYNKLGLVTVKDILEYYPRAYENRGNVKEIKDAVSGENASFVVKINSIIDDRKIYNSKRKYTSLVSYLVEDETGFGRISFFNQNFIKKQLKIGNKYVMNGKVNIFNGEFQLTNPFFTDENKIDDFLKINPLYSLKKNINNNEIINLTKQAVSLNLYEESLPKKLIDKYRLVDKNIATKNIHFPKDRKSFIASRNRLVYEELLIFQLSLLLLKNFENDYIYKPLIIKDKVFDFINKLPFSLTEGQNKVLNEIFEDLSSSKKMNRLLQGDVGSGKTIIAIITMYLCFLNNKQSTIMAPTEILAKQHYISFKELLEPLGVKVELLVGSTSKKRKEEILKKVAIGEIDILIGTHAVIEEDVIFKDLALNITDEQHRFGVKQRQNLNKKDDNSHILVMTATPIPRTLSLILYGDLSISTIDTMPPNRKKIETIAINKSMLNRALNFVRKEIESGRQAYIICPLIEESEYFDLNSAREVYEDLKNNYFKDLTISLLHGRMSSEEKNVIMDEFKNKKIDIIVSTTVIEVGVNVPNASVILVYNAERFGLAQLHQLRGRVGRGEYKSYCILYNESKSKISWERMKVMTNSTDGFYIANKDLELRGSGDLFGVRQSGIMNFKISDLTRDINILKFASDDAKDIIKSDPNLSKGENRKLKEEILKYINLDTTILN